MDANTLAALDRLVTTPLSGQRAGTSGRGDASWFEALARAWGEALDEQALRIQDLSNQVGPDGTDSPSQFVDLTAESLRMSFLANSQSTSTNSVGQALETMARKQ